MCEKRTKKIRKGSQLTQLREARRLQRLQRLSSPSSTNNNITVPCPPAPVNQQAQNRVIIELAWKTLILMHKNRLIQQKITELKKETSEFVAAVMKNPENKRRYLENIRLYGSLQNQVPKPENNSPLKVEPKA